ncbi:MAG: hypothetical protein H8E38_02415 [SAR324 cluster bacterium]|nr:hypothetical protein [SAR324 cluster bacterium]MBL7034688.1 hypothetical protein [SAR324 cluster bacterium]
MNVNQASNSFLHEKSVNGVQQLSPFSGSHKLSFENIRSFRQQFEEGSTTLRSVLGDAQHQTMLVAMYEGTEKLLNQEIPEFAVLTYLEGLKLTARDLRQQGLSGENFRTSLLEHSASTVRDLVRSS